MAKTDEEHALDIEIAYAQRKAQQAISALIQDIRVFGSADRNRKQRAKEALAYVNGLTGQRAAILQLQKIYVAP